MFYQGREDPLTFTVVEYKMEYKGSGKETRYYFKDNTQAASLFIFDFKFDFNDFWFVYVAFLVLNFPQYFLQYWGKLT